MKKNGLSVLVTLALTAALGLALAGCDQSSSGGGNGGGSLTPANEVKARWGDDVAVVNDTTVRLTRSVTIGGGVSASLSASKTVLRAAGDSRFIPTGVRLIVPSNMTLTVKTGGTLNTFGTLELEDKGTNAKGGEFVVEDGTVTLTGAVVAKASAVIEITGGTVTISGTITAGADSEVNFAGGTITIKADAKIEASADSKDAKPNITFGVKVTQEKGATIGKDIVITGGEKITVVDPPTTPPAGGETTQPPVFSRPGTATQYTVVSYSSGVVSLRAASGTATQYTVTDANLAKIFNAVYTPNAPGTTDTIESGKTTIAYNAAISQAALSLFTVTVGSSSAGDKIEIKGTGLPAKSLASPAASNTRLIVIDIGVPGADNSGLKFYIPDRQLGSSANGGYDHIRFRVNNGAETVILADNSGYISNGQGNSCPAGNFKNGCIEVMAGGKLRDGAYEGFPLGDNAVILNRFGSYLAVGPESSFSSATSGYTGSRDKWYEGWLIGPSGSSPRIEWNGSGNYIEVRPGKLAISANVTVKKTLGLIYSVWFIGNTTVTIDAAADSNTIRDKKGLFANGNGYKFYGTSGAKIVIKSGSTLHKVFLTANGTDATNFVTANGTDKTITGKTNGTSVTYENGISGYLSWNVPNNGS